MSGFVAWLETDGASVDPDCFAALMPPLAVCGPDRREVWRDGSGGRVALGHTLFNETLDFDEDRQPGTFDGVVRLVADVRLDARDELISRLRSAGRVVTQRAPDAQLLLHAYHAWGTTCVDHLAGEFAFVVWDGRERLLFSARDHFGVRPLYYAMAGGALLVSNAVNALRRHPRVSDRFNDETIANFLLIGVNFDPSSTTFRDIRQVPPAHVLIWNGAAAVRRYWSFPRGVAPIRFRRSAEYGERFRELFVEAVRDRVRTDRVAMQLSGGLDSTSIAVTTRQILDERRGAAELRAYTIVWKDFFVSEEGPYAKLVAGAAGITSEDVVGDADLHRPPPDDPAWVFPEPCELHDSMLVRLSQRAAAWSRVMLFGFGGDTLFHDGRTLGAMLTSGANRVSLAELWQGWTTHRFRPPLGLRAAWERATGGRIRNRPKGFNPDFAARVDLDARQREADAFTVWHEGTDCEQMLSPFWPALFNWAHPAASGVGAYPVYPFFDLRLLRFVLATPAMPWRASKQMLRDAMRGWLPEQVRLRPKRLLHSASDRPASRLAQIPEVRTWRRALVKGTPALGEFVDLGRLTQVIDGLDHTIDDTHVARYIVLADWLRHQGRGVSRGDRHVRAS